MAIPGNEEMRIDCRGRPLVVGREARVVGILNVTPDSFSDGGLWMDPEEAESRARRMVEEGASLIDVGGQSTRPGHVEITSAEEIGRVLPVLRRIIPALPVPVSIDTHKPEVARAALAAGAHIVNDIHGFQGDPEMAFVAAEYAVPAILMHHDREFRETPGDTLDKIKRYFVRSLEIAFAAKIPAPRLILDPGIGFFKTQDQNLEILARIGELKSFGLPLLLGVSRKSVIGHVLGGVPPERLEGTLASSVLAVCHGVELIRVHDVLANLRAIRMAEAILRHGAQKSSLPGAPGIASLQ